MSEIHVIETTLARTARRRRLARAWNGLWRGLLVGASLWLFVLALYKLLPIPPWAPAAAGFAALAAALAGFIHGGWRSDSLAGTAHWVDLQERLKERLSTALEVNGVSAPGLEEWRALVLTDALAHAEQVDPRRLVRFTLPGASRWALLALVLVAGLGFVPEYRSESYRAAQRNRNNVREVAQRLAQEVKQLKEAQPAMKPVTEEGLRSVEELAAELARAQLTPHDALKQVASAMEKLRQQMNELGREPGFQKLREAAQTAGQPGAQDASALQKQLEALQKALGGESAKPEKMAELQQKLEQLKDAARGLADKTGADAEAARQEMANTLSALAQQAQAMGLNLPDLEKALEALQAANPDLFVKDMEAATRDLERLRELAKQLQQLAAKAEKLGKDLAEQLERGQGSAAIARLEKLAEMLKSGQMSAEDLQKLMQEVSKAVDPAEPYGQTAQHLRDAAQSMSKGDQQGAAQSLAKAAKELSELMQGMGDADALADALDLLKKASLCIGSGQNWGLCQMPGLGEGGRPGGGVGTWAENDGANPWTGDNTGLWDNSGLERPDLDPRSTMGQAPDQLNPALRPTKQAGQFGPGGQMQAVPFKASIVGRSHVQVVPGSTASQTDAESASSLDKIPRAYQAPVKGYFDGMPK